MSGVVLVGVDIGSTRIKVVVVDEHGNERASAVEPTPWVIDGPRVEMDAAHLADAVRSAIGASLASVDTPVAAVGVTGMGESGVLLDRTGAPTSPIVAWHDQRGDVARLADELPDLPARTGVPFNPTATVFKLPLLLAAHAGRRWLNVPEWVVRSLGGDEVAEMSLAGRTGLQDLHTADWWPDGLAALGVDEGLFPGTPRLGTDGAGTATFGPIAGATLAVAGHDHQAAAFAAGATVSGCLFESLGTADALTMVTEPAVPASAVAELTAGGTTVGRTVVADRLIVIAGLRTGLVLQRVARLLGLDAATRHEVSARAAELGAEPSLEVALDGDRVRIGGIGDHTGPAELWRAAVAASDRRTDEIVEQFSRLLGAPSDVVVGGGWLHDPAIAAAIERRFPTARRSRFAEPGAVGAAATAGIAAGLLDGPFTPPANRPTEADEANLATESGGIR